MHLLFNALCNLTFIYLLFLLPHTFQTKPFTPASLVCPLVFIKPLPKSSVLPGPPSPFYLLQLDSSPRLRSSPSHSFVLLPNSLRIQGLGIPCASFFYMLVPGSPGPDVIFFIPCAGLHNRQLPQSRTAFSPRFGMLTWPLGACGGFLEPREREWAI